MLERLKKKWKVNNTQLTLILVTFALGGSLCGYLGRRLLSLTDLHGGFYTLVYFVTITLLWPLCVYTLSFITGQQRFFRNYLRKIGRRMGL